MSDPRHAAAITTESMTEDLHAGLMEGLSYWPRNGKHRAVEALNPATGITTTFKDADA